MNVPQKAVKILLRMFAAEVVRQSYLGVLAREVDPQGLSVYTPRLRHSADIVWLLRELQASDEHWAKILEVRAPELVRALYRGLFGRAPDRDGLKGYADTLAQTHDLTPLLSEMVRSDEHWRRTLHARAPEVTRAILAGLGNKEPDPAALEAYATQLTETRDLTDFVAAAAVSDHAWDQHLSVRAPQIVESIYRSLLERDPDPSGLQSYSATLAEPNGFNKVFSTILSSQEFGRLHQKSAAVFLHIQKTAGTSMQGMLRDAFGKNAYTGHNDILESQTPRELSAFSVYAGHFNHDSLHHIPWKRLRVFTFVREPRDRLISLYYFWRAHEPTAPNWSGGMKVANELSIEDFFARQKLEADSGIWNHMTWAIMGQQQWEAWRMTLIDATAENAARFIAAVARPAIRQRLREFAFVGMQEDYDRSIAMLCEIFKWPRFKKVRADHGLKQLMQKNPHFKRQIDRQPASERLIVLLEGYVQLDNVVYEEAKQLYAERIEQFGQSTRSGGSEVARTGPAMFSASDLQEEKLVFLHLPKTGGTTLHNLLLAHFKEEQVCPERFNGLRHYMCGELVRYRYFSGHYDLPSINLIPGRKRIITMLREPSDRLISLYYFQRAHRADVIERQKLDLARLANKYSMAEFFRAEEVRSHCGVNNALTRVLTQTVGGRRWEQRSGTVLATEGVEDKLPQALEELKAFAAYGIMEQYDLSVRLIFPVIGLTVPATIEKRQVFEVIVEREPGLRKIDKEPVTDEIRELIAGLVQVDTQLYQQAKRIFEARASALRDSVH